VALPTSYQWTPANNGTRFPTEQFSHVSALDKQVEAQRQQEQAMLVWGLCIAAMVFVAVIAGAIRFRRVLAPRTGQTIANDRARNTLNGQ
jgi:hypothetical protein